MDAYSPLPVHGLGDAIGYKHSFALAGFVMGILGGVAGYLLLPDFSD